MQLPFVSSVVIMNDDDNTTNKKQFTSIIHAYLVVLRKALVEFSITYFQ